MHQACLRIFFPIGCLDFYDSDVIGDMDITFSLAVTDVVWVT